MKFVKRLETGVLVDLSHKGGGGISSLLKIYKDFSLENFQCQQFKDYYWGGGGI